MATFDLKAWLAGRPECVRRLAREFPLGSTFLGGGVTMHLIGWTDDDSLLVTPIDPHRDYEAAYAARTRLCARHVREAGG